MGYYIEFPVCLSDFFLMPLSQTDVYGTCTSRYERRGPVLLKTRDLKQCQESRLANFWPHSIALTEDTVSLPFTISCKMYGNVADTENTEVMYLLEILGLLGTWGEFTFCNTHGVYFTVRFQDV